MFILAYYSWENMIEVKPLTYSHNKHIQTKQNLYFCAMCTCTSSKFPHYTNALRYTYPKINIFIHKLSNFEIGEKLRVCSHVYLSETASRTLRNEGVGLDFVNWKLIWLIKKNIMMYCNIPLKKNCQFGFHADFNVKFRDGTGKGNNITGLVRIWTP